MIAPVFAGCLISNATENIDPQLDVSHHECLRCHGSNRYNFVDPTSGESVSLKMYEELRIDPMQYSKATHGHFGCTDCHSLDYEIHPHPISVKFEPTYLCMDCHGNDERFVSFNFETIENEFNASIHAEHLIERFSCWSCHNPHTYKSIARKAENISGTVAYDNSMCLGCHGDISHYAVLVDRQPTNMLSKHDWLPNQSLHFRKVRCIDCHAQTNDELLVAHHVLPASKAVRKCVECHSTNSILMASLYKHLSVERRNEYGFFNAAVTNEAYIIGANRNYYFNLISVILFVLVLTAISIHASLRYVQYRRRKNEN
ncbi:MAG: hypothetical protein U1C46_10370 [Bacteroidales bacterium]|nr:hypothetical protein [Bacteroidales bacterium]